jgi:hypothetical protein
MKIKATDTRDISARLAACDSARCLSRFTLSGQRQLTPSTNVVITRSQPVNRLEQCVTQIHERVMSLCKAMTGTPVSGARLERVSSNKKRENHIHNQTEPRRFCSLTKERKQPREY